MIFANTRSQRGFQITILIILCLGAIVAMAPMVYMASTAFKPNAYAPEFPPTFIPDNPTLANFETAFSSRNFVQAFFNSLGVAVTTACLITTLTAMMAYAFARFDFRGKNVLYYSVLAMMMVPTMMLIIPQFIVAGKLNMLNSLPGLVLVYTAGALAFNMFLLRGSKRSRAKLEESALIDGANHFVIFARIMVLARPLSTVAVFSFLGAGRIYLGAHGADRSGEAHAPIAIANFRGQHASDRDWCSPRRASVVPTIVLSSSSSATL